MRERNSTLTFLVVLLGIVGFVSWPSGKSTSANNDSESPAPEVGPDDGSAIEPGFHRPLQEYFAVLSVPEKKAANGQENAVLLEAVKSAHLQLKFLVATVPDPVDTHFGHYFDALIDAIQRAVEIQEKCVLDRYWYPWPAADKQAASKRQEQSVPSGSPGRVPLHERQPGVLLFRRTEPPNYLQVVFLVGEMPTAGIHKLALTTSLTFIRDALEKGVAKETGTGNYPIKILGPYFSGSAHSLKMALQTWADQAAGPSAHRLCFEILCGSALSVQKDIFNKCSRSW